jgi:hypothetical protein
MTILGKSAVFRLRCEASRLTCTDRYDEREWQDVDLVEDRDVSRGSAGRATLILQAHSAHERTSILDSLIKHWKVEGRRQEGRRMQRAAQQPEHGRPRSQETWRYDSVPLGDHEVDETGYEEDETDDEQCDGLFLTPTVVARAGEPDDEASASGHDEDEPDKVESPRQLAPRGLLPRRQVEAEVQGRNGQSTCGEVDEKDPAPAGSFTDQASE